ncbi:hypothetical protein CH373_04085 [Leptospira perolatii]|uniref:Uncharacterized protein n=1 Tax=Leptospira perolatii TaxID=2023191 RepID=A0A2M9ZQ69_9LEPT|nr:hypothetical protein CH360_13245 [Leptospira perolatii]PJZ74111.1 hypothetical protein CH373_04085 [Leptospira perolatii]
MSRSGIIWCKYIIYDFGTFFYLTEKIQGIPRFFKNNLFPNLKKAFVRKCPTLVGGGRSEAVVLPLPRKDIPVYRNLFLKRL